MFHIPAGTGKGPYNTITTPIVGHVGDTIMFINDDSVPHRVHDNGIPGNHMPTDIPSGGSEAFKLLKPYDSPALGSGNIYDHDSGPAAKICVQIMP
jgi:hypothetical protein